MKTDTIPRGYLDDELNFQFSRSSGPGGQNVNKVNTRAELRFNIKESKLLSDDQKNILNEKLVKKINNDHELIIVSQSERSQLANKEAVVEKFYDQINKALKVRKRRIKTKPTEQSVLKRLKEKKENSEKKSRRRIF